ncbi:MAG: DUF4892 domain-containing protein, partial [bacterium]
MKRIVFNQDIRPLSEFRANAAALIKQVRSAKRPMVITQHPEENNMKVQYAKMFCLLGMFLLTTNIAFAQNEDVKGSKDHRLIGRFLGSKIIGYDQRDYNEFTIALGPQTRDENDKIILKKSRRVEGKVTRILYLTPQGKSTLQVYRNYEKALKKSGFQLLFSCFGADCGTLFQYTP